MASRLILADAGGLQSGCSDSSVVGAEVGGAKGEMTLSCWIGRAERGKGEGWGRRVDGLSSPPGKFFNEVQEARSWTWGMWRSWWMLLPGT